MYLSSRITHIVSLGSTIDIVVSNIYGSTKCCIIEQSNPFHCTFFEFFCPPKLFQTHTRASSDVKAPPVAPPFKPPTKMKPVETLENFKELAQHRKGLFRKKVTIANMLCWTKVNTITVVTDVQCTCRSSVFL